MEVEPNECEDNLQSKSEICQFYKGQNILITGGTGFLGKILIEKLLRSTDVTTIYLLIREKKGKNVHTRLDEIFDNVIFERLKKERPKFRHRVVALAGDCSITGLGLTINDRHILMSNVNIVFHVAATVRFDENIKLAYSINVKGTQDVIELCRQIKNLKALMHVSTAYSNCHLDKIEERFYDYPMNYEDVGIVLEKLTKDEADKLTERLIGNWPNTYTFTKALAESLIRSTCAELPIGIYRPSIVISTYKEPIESWIDNLYGPTGACAGAASGILRVLRCNENVIADLVPVDTCVAGLLAAAWDTSKKPITTTTNNIPIYNYVSSVDNPITWYEFNVLNTEGAKFYPTSNALWATSCHTISNAHMYFLMRFFFHFIPAVVMDSAVLLTGHKPRLLKMYEKIHKFTDVISFFCLREWHFRNDNVQKLWLRMSKEDQMMFPFHMRQVPWLVYFRSYLKGIRIYLLNDPIDTLDKAKLRMARFRMVHNVFMYLLRFLGMGILWYAIIKMSGFNIGSSVILAKNILRSNSSTGNTCEFLSA